MTQTVKGLTVPIDGRLIPVIPRQFPPCAKHGKVVGVYAAGYAFQHCPKCHAEMKARKVKDETP